MGRSSRVDNGDVIDDSTRSIEPHVYHKLVKKLSQKYNIILMAEPDFINVLSAEDSVSEKPQGVDLRFWSAVIESVDYFIGCDSVGQHMAHAMKKPATVVIGATFPENISYPSNKKFTIIDIGEGKRRYQPIRLTADECADRNNEDLMVMDKDIIKKILKSIKDKIGVSKQSTPSTTSPPTTGMMSGNSNTIPLKPLQTNNNFGFDSKKPIGKKKKPIDELLELETNKK